MEEIEIRKKIETLRCHFAHADHPESVLYELALVLERKVYPKGSYIFHAGDPSDKMHFLENGRVIVSKDSSEGKSIICMIGNRGMTLNAVTCFRNRPRFFNAKTVEESEILETSSDHFTQWVTRHPETAVSVIDTLGLLVDTAYNRILDLIDENVEQRILNTITTMSARLGKEIFVTHTELAELTGTSRETAARVVSNLQKNGIIRKSRARLEIIDAEKLNELSSGKFLLL